MQIPTNETDSESLADRIANLLRDNFNWERRVGKALLSALSAEMLDLPIRVPADDSGSDGRTVLDVIVSLMPDDKVIDNSVRDALAMLKLEPASGPTFPESFPAPTSPAGSTVQAGFEKNAY